MESFLNILLDSALDVLRMTPIIIAACFLSEFIIARRKAVASANSIKGIATGSLLGAIPQCGISAGFAQLYVSGLIGLSVLMSVFISGSDEAIVFAAGTGDFKLVLQLLGTKILSGFVVGVAIYAIEIYRHKKAGGHFIYSGESEISVSGYCGHGHKEHHHEGHSSSTKDILLHSLKNAASIIFYVFISVVIIELLVSWIGFATIETLFMRAGMFQPVLTALIGLIPSCAVSIFLTETYLTGFISFGALIAGLCANTGYGIVVIFKALPTKRALTVLGVLFGSSAVIGMVLHFVLGFV